MCNLSISRERRMGYSARRLRIYLNGTTLSLSNGETVNTNLAPGKHNIGFAIGNEIATEMNFQVEDGTDQVDIKCWVEFNGGVTVRLADYNISHTITERDTLGKTANKAVSGTFAVIITLLAVGLVGTFLLLLRLI